MICWRVWQFDPAVGTHERGGPLWFPRELQGDGRHDNPDVYGCMYASGSPVGAVVEQLAEFRGLGRLAPWMLRKQGRPLAFASIELNDEVALLDLDDPQVLLKERLRPSQVATRARAVTQRQAAGLYISHPEAAGLRWWSTIEASLTNLTLFDRAAHHLSINEIHPLTIHDEPVQQAAELLALLA